MAATIKDIAKQTGLGLATISSYLNGGNVRQKNKIAIEAAIEAMGFEVNQVARGLKTKKTMTIGVVIPELSNLFCTTILSLIEDRLREEGYATIVCDCRTDPQLEEQAVRFLLSKQVDGLISMPVSTTGAHLTPAKEKGIPIVLIDRKITGMDAVVVDNIAACYEATAKLLSLGHREIGIVCGPADITTAAERLEGYRQAFVDQGLPTSPSLIAMSDYTMQSGRDCLYKLLQQHPTMTAVLMTNYELTIGGMMAINELGLQLPEQLSVIGFDGLEFCKAMRPALSVVTQPHLDIARHTADQLLQRLQGDDSDSMTITLKTTFIEGASTSPLSIKEVL